MIIIIIMYDNGFSNGKVCACSFFLLNVISYIVIIRSTKELIDSKIKDSFN